MRFHQWASVYIVHRILLCIHWNIVSNETFLFKSRLISSIFILHQPSKKKRKEKERALILSLFVQSNKAKKVGFFSILPSDRQINWSARERTGQIFASPLFRSRGIDSPLLLPHPLPSLSHSRINSKVIRARSSSNKMHRDELASIREELIVCTEANYSEALKFKSISSPVREGGGKRFNIVPTERSHESGKLFSLAVCSRPGARRTNRLLQSGKWLRFFFSFLSPRRIRGEGGKKINTHA